MQLPILPTTTGCTSGRFASLSTPSLLNHNVTAEAQRQSSDSLYCGENVNTIRHEGWSSNVFDGPRVEPLAFDGFLQSIGAFTCVFEIGGCIPHTTGTRQTMGDGWTRNRSRTIPGVPRGKAHEKTGEHCHIQLMPRAVQLPISSPQPHEYMLPYFSYIAPIYVQLSRSMHGL